MRVFLAATDGKFPQYSALESYVTFMGGRSIGSLFQRPIFLDSGAYTMFTKGKSIPLKQYADFINREHKMIEFAANLDYIGAASPVEAADRTIENQRKLEELVKPSGAYIIPVYHVREPVSYLEALVKKYPFIALGGMVPESKGDLNKMLDEVWDRVLTDKHGHPKIKVHGFGMTILDLMLRYPWYSVDSTSWVIYAAFGYITWMDGPRQVVVPISPKKEMRRMLDMHYDSMAEPHRAETRKQIALRGFDIDRIREDHDERRKFNAVTYAEEIANLNPPSKTFKKPFGDLFNA